MMGLEAGKLVVRFCVRFRDRRTKMDADESDGRKNEHRKGLV